MSASQCRLWVDCGHLTTAATDPFRTSRLTGRAIRIGIFGYPLADVPFASTSILRPNALFGPHTIRHGGSGENSSPK
jgi:hypothetical protein